MFCCCSLFVAAVKRTDLFSIGRRQNVCLRYHMRTRRNNGTAWIDQLYLKLINCNCTTSWVGLLQKMDDDIDCMWLSVIRKATVVSSTQGRPYLGICYKFSSKPLWGKLVNSKQTAKNRSSARKKLKIPDFVADFFGSPEKKFLFPTRLWRWNEPRLEGPS